jgi:copper chaperone CopZ
MLPSTPRTFIGSTTFTVTGLTCTHCRRAITADISAIEGISDVVVDPVSGTVTVTSDRPVDRADIAAVLDEAGHTLTS